jgi:hypothetical protein
MVFQGQDPVPVFRLENNVKTYMVVASSQKCFQFLGNWGQGLVLPLTHSVLLTVVLVIIFQHETIDKAHDVDDPECGILLTETTRCCQPYSLSIVFTYLADCTNLHFLIDQNSVTIVILICHVKFECCQKEQLIFINVLSLIRGI